MPCQLFAFLTLGRGDEIHTSARPRQLGTTTALSTSDSAGNAKTPLSPDEALPSPSVRGDVPRASGSSISPAAPFRCS